MEALKSFKIRYINWTQLIILDCKQMLIYGFIVRNVQLNSTIIEIVYFSEFFIAKHNVLRCKIPMAVSLKQNMTSTYMTINRRIVEKCCQQLIFNWVRLLHDLIMMMLYYEWASPIVMYKYKLYCVSTTQLGSSSLGM